MFNELSKSILKHLLLFIFWSDIFSLSFCVCVVFFKCKI